MPVLPRPHWPLRLPASLCLVSLAALLAGCAATAPHPAPRLDLPTAFAHEQGWLATSALEQAPPETIHAHWWQVYADPALDALLQQVTQDNATLEQASAQWRQAQAAVAAARASRYPQLDGDASASRSGDSDSRAQSRLASTLSIGWLPDLWGRTALQTQASAAQAEAAAANLAATQLALQLTAAEQYTSLRRLALDARLLEQTLAAYARSLSLTQNQYDAGLVARADVIQAQIQHESVRSQMATNQQQQALARNALALLAGTTAAQWGWKLPDDAPLPEPPAIPRQLVASLLLQRPDIAAASQSVAAANARLGMAQTAWLPDIRLNASAGLQGSGWSQFIESPLRVWSLGPTLAASLFDGGSRRAATAQAQADYDAQAAAWRAAVLQAVQEVEDALASAQWLHTRQAHQQQLLQLSRDNLRVVQNQYEAGMVSYLDVVTAQNLALSSQRSALELQAQRLQASMQLVAALGGGWQGRATTSTVALTPGS